MKKLIFILIILIITAIVSGYFVLKPEIYSKRFIAIGTFCEVNILSIPYFVDPDRVFREVKSEIDRLDRMLSPWQGASELALINRNAGRGAVGVSTELFKFIEMAGDIFTATGGKLTLFSPERRTDDAKNYISLYENRRKVFLKFPGIKLDPICIERGFIIDKIVEVLKSNGIHNASVGVSSDIKKFTGRDLFDLWCFSVKSISGGPLNFRIKRDSAFFTGIKDLVIISPDAVVADAAGNVIRKIKRSEWERTLKRIDNVSYYFIDKSGKEIFSESLDSMVSVLRNVKDQSYIARIWSLISRNKGRE